MQTVSKLFKALFLSDEHVYQMLKAGGARRDRTDDLLNANQALSQLSYGPEQAGTLSQPVYGATKRSLKQAIWWAWIDSNYRPHPYQGCALTT